MNKHLAVVAVVFMTLGAVACSGDDGDDGATETTVEERSTAEDGGWTVLHYSMADTDLEPFMVGDVNEMGEVGSQDGLAVRAFVDRSADYGDDELLDQGAWVGARVLDIGEGTAELVKDLGDVNSADPATLATFIAEGIEDHPAERYSLIISDHGASWPGIGPDEGSENDVLDLAQIVEGISAGLEQAGVDKLDLLGFDACLMGSYEVASAVAPLADRLVASQELEPGHGWDYGSLQTLVDDPAATADDFGASIVDGFADQAEEEGTNAEITLALIDLTKMAAVDEALASFGAALAERAATVAPVVGRANAATLGFARSPDETEDSHMKDLGLLASAIGVDALDVSDEADTLVRAINDAVLDSVDGAATNGATGLSIYFPPSPELADDAYSGISSADSWRAFLTSFYTAGDAIPDDQVPEFTDPTGAAQVSFDEDGVTISGTFDANGQGNLTEAIISYALVGEDGSLTYIGEEPATLDPDGAPVAEGFYDLTALKISDGEDEAYAYVTLDFEDDAEVFTIDVPMAYYAEGDQEGETYQDVLLSLTINAETGDVENETYYAYDPETQTFGELTADPAGIIVPEVLTLTAEGEEEWTPTTSVGLFAELENLQYELEPLESGTQLQLDLTVLDFNDNSDTVSALVQVP